MCRWNSINICYNDHVDMHVDERGVEGIPDLTMYLGDPDTPCYLDYEAGGDTSSAVRHGPLNIGSAVVLDARIAHESISSAWHEHGAHFTLNLYIMAVGA
jgi:hypothetical protein